MTPFDTWLLGNPIAIFGLDEMGKDFAFVYGTKTGVAVEVYVGRLAMAVKGQKQLMVKMTEQVITWIKFFMVTGFEVQ